MLHDGRTVNSQADNQTNARTDAVNRLHHVMTSISASNFSYVQGAVFQCLHVGIADDHFEILSICFSMELRKHRMSYRVTGHETAEGR